MNILIIDEQRLFAEGLKNMLKIQSRITNVYLYNNKHSEMDFYLYENVDLVIFDIYLPEGLSIISEIRKKIKKPMLLVLSGLTNPGVVKKAIKMGAHAFVSKNSTMEELMEGIEEISTGKIFISSGIRGVIVNTLINGEKDDVDSIKAKEKEILIALYKGNTIKEISIEMGLSTYTINYYLRNMMKKIKVSRTLDLILYALKKGIYSYDQPI